VSVRDISPAYTSLGLWGPKARRVLQPLVEKDLSNEAFPYFTAQRLTIESTPALAFRLSYAGELGWEIYTPTEYGSRLWDLLWRAGQTEQIIPAGMGAFSSLRLEKGYRAVGSDLTVDDNPFEAGLGWAVDLDQPEFKGRQALQEIKDQGISRKLCCLTMDDGTALGNEPIRDGGQVLGYVTSTNYGYSVGKHIAYGYLPIDYAEPGTGVEIEYLGTRYPAVVSEEPLFDPEMKKLKS
jgi:glycine cleavage system aminomethyltransferase T